MVVVDGRLVRNFLLFNQAPGLYTGEVKLARTFLRSSAFPPISDDQMLQMALIS